MREVKGTAGPAFSFGAETPPPAPTNVELQEEKRKPTAKHAARQAKH
jgi:hypothetical protein